MTTLTTYCITGKLKWYEFSMPEDIHNAQTNNNNFNAQTNNNNF